MESQEQKNLLLAVVLSIAIFVGFQIMFPTPQPVQQADQSPGGQQAGEAGAPTTPDVEVPSLTPGTQPEQVGDPTVRDRAAVVDETPRVGIDTPSLSGSISLEGGRIDDLVLTKYRTALDPKSEKIELLHPLGTAKSYYADFGWAAADRDIVLPDAKTRWEAVGAKLEPGKPVTLSWDNGQGLRFERVYEVDPDYMFTVTQRIINETEQPVTLSPYGLISRRGTPETLGFYILHEGPLGVFNGTLEEIDYSDLKDEAQNGTKVDEINSTGGWLGITDKYWLVALVPRQGESFTGRFVYDGRAGADKYQADYLGDSVTVPSGGQSEVTNRLFAGAKVVELIDRYEEQIGIDKFDRTIDFGWFYFLTKPLFYLLHFFAANVGNFGIAILLLTVVIKLAFFPLANKSYKAMAKMRALQPEMVKMRERFGDDRQRLNQEMMELYKKEKVNPMSGCLPMLVQIPVFFALYKVLFVTIEMRHAPFYGWIQDLSAPDPTSILNGFGLLPWEIGDLGIFNMISIGVWPLLMGLTMFLQTKLNPQPADPIQARIFTWMPIFFMFLLANFPAGLVIYWTWNNVLSIIQQYVIMRRAGVPIGGKAKT